jgi:hypothetical protein
MAAPLLERHAATVALPTLPTALVDTARGDQSRAKAG